MRKFTDIQKPQDTIPLGLKSIAEIEQEFSAAVRNASEKRRDDPNKQFVHAYYDHLPNVAILRVRFSVTNKVTIEYYVDAAANCDASLLGRLQHHFSILQLAKHYQQEANLELSDRGDAIRDIFAGGNSIEVRTYLTSEAKSVRRSRGINNWKTALLTSLADSQSFPDSSIPVLLAQYS